MGYGSAKQRNANDRGIRPHRESFLVSEEEAPLIVERRGDDSCGSRSNRS